MRTFAAASAVAPQQRLVFGTLSRFAHEAAVRIDANGLVEANLDDDDDNVINLLRSQSNRGYHIRWRALVNITANPVIIALEAVVTSVATGLLLIAIKSDSIATSPLEQLVQQMRNVRL